MQKLVIGMINNRGFTLIEIMIVIVIIGITIGFALISFGDFGESKRVMFAAEQLVNTLQLSQQQAILETSTLGLKIDNANYQILQLHNNNQWQPLAQKGIFKLTPLPHDTQITLTTSAQAALGAPPIVIYPSGDLTPFTLTFGSKKESKIAVLIGKHNGELLLKAADNK